MSFLFPHFFHIGSHVTKKRREQAPALQDPRCPAAPQSLYVFQSTHKFACEFKIEKDIKRNKAEQRNERSLRAGYTKTHPYTLSFPTKHFLSARKKRYGVRETADPYEKCFRFRTFFTLAVTLPKYGGSKRPPYKIPVAPPHPSPLALHLPIHTKFPQGNFK